MRVSYLGVKNFKSIVDFELDKIPDIVVLAGPNGSGKTAVLQALTFFKERVGPYAEYSIRNPVNTKAEFGEISVKFQVYPPEKTFLNQVFSRPTPLRSLSKPVDVPVPSTLEGTIRVDKAGNVIASQIDRGLSQLLQMYNPQVYPGVGIFDYNDAHRSFQESDVSTLNLAGITTDAEKSRRVSPGNQKFNTLKQFLAQLKLEELQRVQNKTFDVPSSLEPVRKLFNELLSPKEFGDVDLGSSPARFLVKTPSGDIDIDDLSSGEKEVLFFYADMIRMKPQNSIILIDEPDLHLNQELERRIVAVLRDFGPNNQFWIATHSLGIMNSVDPTELFKVESFRGRNQVSRVFEDSERYDLFRSVAGDAGIMTLGEKIVFCEGAKHTDVAILQAWFKTLRNKVVFVPCGGKSETAVLSERLLELLKVTSRYSQFFAIRDRDFLEDNEIEELTIKSENKFFVWDRYEIENYLLDFELIAELANEMGISNGNVTPTIVKGWLLDIVREDELHFANQLGLSLVDIRLRAIRNRLRETGNKLVGKDLVVGPLLPEEELGKLLNEAHKRVAAWISDGLWIKRLPGKGLLAKFVNTHITGVAYDRFRRQLVNRISNRNRIPDSVTSTIERITKSPAKDSA